MAEPVSDEAAKAVALNIQQLEQDGCVSFVGFVMRSTTAGNDGPLEDATAPTFRLYTTPKFDRWLEIKKVDLLFQKPVTPDGGVTRSQVFIKATASITQSQSMSAEYAAQFIDTGGDDPTAYPRGR